jgi:hypothetical protein
MSDNIKRPASETAKPHKLLLFPGDHLINVLKPDYYIIVDPSTLQDVTQAMIDNPDAYQIPDDGGEDPGFTDPSSLQAPNLEDIVLVSKTIVTDKNKNQFVDFVFEIKNHVGSDVVGVNAYGQ